MRKFFFINHKGFYIRTLAAGFESSRAPVAVIKEDIVLEASSSAQGWGVQEGIRKTLAQRRCPELECVEFDRIKCQPLYEKLWSVYAELTPQVEPMELHQGFLDLTGCERNGRTLRELLFGVNQRLRVRGITSRWGGGQDRWIARLSCGENRFIAPEEEPEFLQRVSIKQLLPGELVERFLRYSVRTVAELRALPRHFIETHLQISSREIRPYLIRDTASVRCLFPPPKIEAEVDIDWLRPEHLENALEELCRNLEQQLAENHLEAGRMRAEFRFRSPTPLCSPKSEIGGKQNDAVKVYEITVSRPIYLAEQAKHFLATYILEKRLQHLQKIHAVLDRLTSRTRMQTDLWHDPQTSLERRDRLLEAQETVRSKHGQALLEHGHETAQRLRPRFAQLIYEERGIYLP